MPKKDYLDQLAEAAEELNKVLGLEPAIVTASTSLGALKDAIKEAATLIQPEDEISSSTQAIIDGLDESETKTKTKTTAKKMASVNMELIKEIEKTTNRRELKLIAKRSVIFEDYVKELATIKDGEALQARMVELVVTHDVDNSDGSIASTIDDVKPAKPAKAQPKPKANGTKTTKEKGAKKPGVIATIVAQIENAGKTGVSKAEILEVLESTFPDRSSESMQKTINVQVPNRIHKERFKVATLENGRYKKA